MLAETILADQKPENITATSKKLAEAFLYLLDAEADKKIKFGNNYVVREDGAVKIFGGQRKLVEGRQDEDGSLSFEFRLMNAIAVSRVIALKQIFKWKFDIASGSQRLWIISDGKPQPLKRGHYSVAELEAISIGIQ